MSDSDIRLMEKLNVKMLLSEHGPDHQIYLLLHLIGTHCCHCEFSFFF